MCSRCRSPRESLNIAAVAYKQISEIVGQTQPSHQCMVELTAILQSEHFLVHSLRALFQMNKRQMQSQMQQKSIKSMCQLSDTRCLFPSSQYYCIV